MTRLHLGLALLGTLALGALAAPVVAAALGHDPFAPDLLARFEPPSARHPLGTDDLGRDILTRLSTARGCRSRSGSRPRSPPPSSAPRPG